MVNFLQAGDKVAANDRGAYYRSESKYIASLVGNEVPADKHDFFKALRYTNEASQLGLNEFEIEVIGRLLSALGKGTRFAGDPVMNKHHGENAATHSLQSVVLMEKLLHQAYQQMPAEQKRKSLAQIQELRQFMGLSLLVHDMGEILGEAAYAGREGVKFVGDFTKAEMEQKIFDRVLNLAIASVKQGQSPEDFAKQMAEMTDVLKINQRAEAKATLSREEVDGLLTNPAYAVQHLDHEGDVLYRQTMALWLMAEKPKEPLKVHAEVKLPKNPALVGMMVKNIEHQQGSSHLFRFATKKTPAQGEEEKIQTEVLEGIDNARIIGNFEYNESELPEIYSLGIKAVEAGSDNFLTHFMRALRDHTYGVSMRFIDGVLSAEKRIDMAAQPDQKAELAAKYLGMLEAIETGYERAVAENRRPQEKSLGAMLFKVTMDKKTPEEMMTALNEALAASKDKAAPLPNVSEVMERRRLQTVAEKRSAA